MSDNYKVTGEPSRYMVITAKVLVMLPDERIGIPEDSERVSFVGPIADALKAAGIECTPVHPGFRSLEMVEFKKPKVRKARKVKT